MNDIAKEICNKLNIDCNLQLKKPIRGLTGITALQLINALISCNGLNEAANLLGYSNNPIKQCINQVLHPIFGSRLSRFDRSPWRTELLASISKRFCSKCNKVLNFTEFTKCKSKKLQLSTYCGKCNVLDSTLKKYYIKERTPAWASLEDLKDFYSNCPKNMQVDHVIPLRGKLVSGLHIVDNLQYLTAEENLAKLNKFAIT